MAEERSLAAGEARIKFTCNRVGSYWEVVKGNRKEKKLLEDTTKKLADLLLYEEKQGYAPMAPDGRIGGNGASKISLNDKTYIIVSKSGKLPGQMDYKNDFCLVSEFDTETWGCNYYSERPDTKPTSDTPMHYSLLMNVKGAFSALHGHAIEKEDVARALGVPCSTEETLFSTPADTKAMFTLLEKYEFPKWKIFVRKNHGFYILGKNLDECREVLDNQLIAKQSKEVIHNDDKENQQKKSKRATKVERKNAPYKLRSKVKMLL